VEVSTTGSGHRRENLPLAAALTTAAFFCVSMVTVLAKVSGAYTSIGMILLVQNVLCLVVMLPVVMRDGVASLRTERFGMHVLRAAMGTACWYAIFLAITLIPLTNAVLLAYSAPLWMPLVAFVVTRQRIARATWIGAGLGFVGVALVLQPEAHGYNLGDLSALAGALFLAVAMMSVRWLGATEPTNRILFYYFLLSSLMMLPIAVLDWRPVPLAAWPWIAALAAAQLASQVLIAVAYRYASAEKVGPFIYSVIVFTALIDWIVWHHRPGLLVFLGMALVIGGGLVAVRARGRGAPVDAGPRA
jgi:drug/metabolite transporter (DMT)-like permease